MIRRQSTESQGERKGILKTQLKYVKQENSVSRNNNGSFLKDSQNISREGRGINGSSNFDNYDRTISEPYLKNAALKDLRPEDKRRVGQLMKKLAEEKQIKENLQYKIQQNSQEFKDKFANSQKEKQGILNDNLALKERLQEQILLLQQYQHEQMGGSQRGMQKEHKEVGQNLKGLDIYKLNSSLPFEGNHPKEGENNLGKSSSISNQHMKQLKENEQFKAEQLVSNSDQYQLSKFNEAHTDYIAAVPHVDQQSNKRITLEKKNGESEQMYKAWKKQSSFDSSNYRLSSSKLFLKETFQEPNSIEEVKVLHSKMSELTHSLQKISQNAFKKGVVHNPAQKQSLACSNSRDHRSSPLRILQEEVRSISKQTINDADNESSDDDEDEVEIEELQLIQRLLSLKKQKQEHLHQKGPQQNKEKQNIQSIQHKKRNSQKYNLDDFQSDNKLQQQAITYLNPNLNNYGLPHAQSQEYYDYRLIPTEWKVQQNQIGQEEEGNDKSSNWKVSKQTAHQIFEDMDKQQLQKLRKQLKKRIKDMSQSKLNSRESVKHSALNTQSNIFELSNTQQLNSMKDSDLLRYSHNTQSLSAPFSKSKDSFTSFAHPTTKAEYYHNLGDIAINRNQYEFGYHPLGESQNYVNKSNHQQNYDNGSAAKQYEYQEQHPNDLLQEVSGQNTGENQKNDEQFEEGESLSSKERLLSKIEELTEEDLEQVMAVIKAKRNKRRIEKNKKNKSEQTEGEMRLRGSELSNSGIRNTDDSGMTKQIVKEVERQYFKEISKQIDQQLKNSNSKDDDDDDESYEEEEEKEEENQRYNNKYIAEVDKQLIRSQDQEQNGYEMPEQMFHGILQEKKHKNPRNNDEQEDDVNSDSNTSRSREQITKEQYEEQVESPDETDRSINSIKRKINQKK